MKTIAWIFAAILFAASGASSAADSVRVAVIGEGLQSTEYSTKHDEVSSMILHHVVESLVAYDDDLVVRPMLAESWDVSDDGRSYVFRLRDNVRYHNGERMSASDVVWNWNRFRDPSRDWGSHCREWYDGSAEDYHRPVTITSVAGDDDANTVTFRLQSRSGVFLHHIASNHCITGIVHPDSVAEGGEWVEPIGTGPYRLVEAGEDGSARLERFANYSTMGGAPSGFSGGKNATIDQLEFEPFASADAALQALKVGRVDFVHDFPIDRIPEVDDLPGIQHVAVSTPAFHQIIVQSRFDPLLENPVMRRAIAHALNPEAIADELFGAPEYANSSAVANSMVPHTEAHDRGYANDPAIVKSLLNEAGYDGEPLTIITSSEPFPTFQGAAEIAARQLREHGIDANVETLDWPEHERRYAQNEYQLTSITFSMRTDPAFMYSAIVGQKADDSWFLWEDMEAAALVAMSAVESDSDKRQKLFDNLHEKMLEWVPTIGIYNHPRSHLMSENIKNYETWPLAYPRFWVVR